ncbi:MAG: hypothetical protein FJ086_01025 [Deltaproteobacteria bacterium]|nr:hypothetical protein [Deltaproteobacteria bacterium]
MNGLLPVLVSSASLLAGSCASRPAVVVQEAAPPPRARPSYEGFTPERFNALAQERFLPLFWRADANGSGAVDPDEVAVLWGPWAETRATFVGAEGFTEAFDAAFSSLQQAEDESGLLEEERQRRNFLRLELSQGKPTLVETDLSGASEEERAVYAHLAKAAEGVERLYARQRGTAGLFEQVTDPLSRAVFHRNQGPSCAAPKTEGEEACTAVWPRPTLTSGLYPAELQADKAFCSALEKTPNGKALMDHFSLVAADGKGGFSAVPYSEGYREDMEAVAASLQAAAGAITSEGEAAFKAYLDAAAKGFRTNDWEPANAAWVAMGPQNSKWYLRVAPDEVYYEPCAWKAGFALQLARINPDSLSWQQRLEPVKGEMEKALAQLAGPPYKARDVKFKLPDFIDVVLNAGDQRPPHGATIGQSLPNWGPTSEKGGRTVAMTNLYADEGSQATLRGQMASVYCKATLDGASVEPRFAVMSTVLHEAAHNLGPSHDYAVKGKKDDDLFGGPLASTMEELKAQTAALYFAPWLVQKGVITQEEADKAALRDIAWALGHVSRGMYDGEGKPRNYSQLASVQLGMAMKAGALAWKPAEKAANGQDEGCFEVDLKKWKPAVDALARRVLQAKGRGDKKDAEAMKKAFVDDGKSEWVKLHAVVKDRWLRAPKATFVYSVKP